jgi:hypothetical protein
MSRNLGALTLLDPSGPAWPVMGVLFSGEVYDFYSVNPECFGYTLVSLTPVYKRPTFIDKGQ